MWFSQRPQIFTLIKWAQNVWLMSFLMHSVLIPWHRLQKSKNPNFWLVQVIWLVQDTYPYAAIWFVWDTYPNAAIWLVWDTYYSTCYKRVYFFFFIEKKNWELCSRTPHYFPYFLLFHVSRTYEWILWYVSWLPCGSLVSFSD